MKRSLILLPLLAVSLFADDLPPMPEAVSSFGAAVSNDVLYTFGGHKAEPHSWSLPTTSGKFQRLDLKQLAKWEELPAGPPSQSPGLTAHAGKVYLVGGMQPQNEDPAKPVLRSLASASVYDPAAHAWTKLPDLPAPRSSHDVTVLDGKLYVMGGWPLDTSKDKADAKTDDRHKVRPMHDTSLVLDLAKPQDGWKSFAQPFQRRALAVVAAGGKVYALGGMDERNELTVSANVYDPATGKWETLPDIPAKGHMKAFAVTACEWHGEVIASPAGGELFALRNGAWQQVGKLQQARFFHRLVPWGDQLISLGGNKGETPLSTLELVTLLRDGAVSSR